MADRPLRLGVVYDFRNPLDSGSPAPALYAEIIDRRGTTDLVARAEMPGLQERMNASLEHDARDAASPPRAAAARRAAVIRPRGA